MYGIEEGRIVNEEIALAFLIFVIACAGLYFIASLIKYLKEHR